MNYSPEPDTQHPITTALVERFEAIDLGLTGRQIADVAQNMLSADAWCSLASNMGQPAPTTATQCIVIAELRDHNREPSTAADHIAACRAMLADCGAAS